MTDTSGGDMDLGAAYLLGLIVRDRVDETDRMRLISAHVANGHSLDSATTLVDGYLASRTPRPGFVYSALTLMGMVIMACTVLAVVLGGVFMLLGL